MCHLVGFIGSKPAVPILLDSLRAQEAIIGAQATGIATFNNNSIYVEKNIGPIAFFEQQMQNKNLHATKGVGHTRYAQKNLKYAETNTIAKAHPFWNSEQTFITMHNGTITNSSKFFSHLEKLGHHFRSKSEFKNSVGEKIVDFCDSEIFSFRLEEELKETDNIKKAIRNACKELQGQFAFVVLHPAYPENIFIANWMQPLEVGYSEENAFFTSFEEGFLPLNESFTCKYSETKNMLIVLTKGKVELETLLPKRKIPTFEIENEILERAILDALQNNFCDVASIWTFFEMNPSKISLTEEEFSQLTKINGYTFTPIIYSRLKEMELNGKIYRRKEFVWEGGIDKIPRYRFYVKED